jgi:hypothetical protein
VLLIDRVSVAALGNGIDSVIVRDRDCCGGDENNSRIVHDENSGPSMNTLKMLLRGDDSCGFEWIVSIDGTVFAQTEPMSRGDLATCLWEIQRDKTRSTPQLCSLSDETLVLLLDGFFHGELTDALRPAAEEQTWAKHVVGPIGPAKISSHMYLVTCDELEDRLLICHHPRASFVRLPRGQFDASLSAIRMRLEPDAP